MPEMGLPFELDPATRERCVKAFRLGRLLTPVRSTRQDKTRELKRLLLSVSPYSIPVFDAKNANHYMSEVREELPAAGDMGERVPGTVGGTAGEGATGGQPYDVGVPFELRVSDVGRRPPDTVTFLSSAKKATRDIIGRPASHKNHHGVRCVLVVCPRTPRLLDLLGSRAALCMRRLTLDGDRLPTAGEQVVPLVAGEFIPGLYVTLTTHSDKTLAFTYCVCLADGRALATDALEATGGRREIDPHRQVYYSVPRLHPTALLEEMLASPKILKMIPHMDVIENDLRSKECPSIIVSSVTSVKSAEVFKIKSPHGDYRI